MQHLRAALDSDPERQARIARYAEMAAQGLPLFNPNDRPSYIRSVREGGPVTISGLWEGLGDE